MRSLLVIVIAAVVAVVAAAAGAAARATLATEPFVLAGYLPDYRAHIDLNSASAYLMDVILFSVEPKPDGTVAEGTCCLNGDHYSRGRAAREVQRTRRSRNLRLFVSVGGAGRSNSFPSIASDPKKRSSLVSNLIALCKREQLQGVDFDWEQPRSREELIFYLHLLLEASDVFHKNNLLVSVALHPGQRLTPQVYTAMDRINLMTYDMITSTGPGSHHSSFEDVQNAVEVLVSGGCSRDKLLLGIPLYGRNEVNPGDVRTYSELVDAALEKRRLVIADTETSIDIQELEIDMKSSYDGFAFDSPSDVRKKVSYAQEAGLQGVFFWEIGQDSFQESLIKEEGGGGILLKAAFTAAAAGEGGGSEKETQEEL